MKARFYSATVVPGETATLADSEAHHLLHVLRARVGDEVTLFDGRGYEYPSRVASCTRNQVTLDVQSRVEVDREADVELTLAVALPKGERQRFLVEKCVELGVARLIPLETRRSVSKIKASALDRLRRAVLESCKQCGRNRLMQIDPPLPCDRLWEQAEEPTRLMAHPGGDERLHDIASSASICVAIGPEGGFEEDEVRAAHDHQWGCVSLGPRLLRIETAAIACAARLLA